LNHVLKNISIKDLNKGIAELKGKIEGKDSAKATLITENYDQFLAAKKVLDRIHRGFVQSTLTYDMLENLEKGMKDLNETTMDKISPLFDCL
jgi:hypothetical protein